MFSDGRKKKEGGARRFPLLRRGKGRWSPLLLYGLFERGTRKAGSPSEWTRRRTSSLGGGSLPASAFQRGRREARALICDWRRSSTCRSGRLPHTIEGKKKKGQLILEKGETVGISLNKKEEVRLSEFKPAKKKEKGEGTRGGSNDRPCSC